MALVSPSDRVLPQMIGGGWVQGYDARLLEFSFANNDMGRLFLKVHVDRPEM
jgi:hypothetical protein